MKKEPNTGEKKKKKKKWNFSEILKSWNNKQPDICHKAIQPTALQYKVMQNSMLNKAGRNMLTEENESYLERTRELLITNILTAQTFLTCLLPL